MKLTTPPNVEIEIRLPHPASWAAAPVAASYVFWDGGEVSNARHANGLAREIAEENAAPEARWNYTGCAQGHYVKGV